MRFSRVTMSVASCAAAILLPLVPARAAPEMDLAALQAAATDLNDAARKNRPETALQELRTIYLADELHLVRHDIVSAAIQVVRRSSFEKQFVEFAYEVTGSKHFTDLSPEVKGVFALDALLRAAKLGDTARTRSLLPLLSDEDIFTFLLADRQFEPLWPVIENYAGDHLQTVLDQEVEDSVAYLRRKPDDLDGFSGLMSSLYEAGKFEDVLDLIGKWHAGRTAADELHRRDAWVMDTEARVLSDMGRTAESEKIFNQIASLSPSKYPWAVNFAINRSAYLISHKRWAEALETSAVAAKAAEGGKGTIFGKMLIARVRTCALYRLGRPQEAVSDLTYLRANFDKATEGGVLAASGGLLCAGLEDETAKRIKEAFATGKIFTYTAMLEDRKFEQSDPMAPDPDATPDVGAFMLSRSALREELFKHIRLIPERFTPAADLRRREQEKKDRKAS